MTSKIFRIALLGAAAAVLLAAGNAEAQSPATATVNVSASVITRCTVTGTTDIVNWQLDPLLGTIQTSPAGAVDFRCTKGGTGTVTIQGGAGGKVLTGAVSGDTIPFSVSSDATGTAFTSVTSAGGGRQAVATSIPVYATVDFTPVTVDPSVDDYDGSFVVEIAY